MSCQLVPSNRSTSTRGEPASGLGPRHAMSASEFPTAATHDPVPYEDRSAGALHTPCRQTRAWSTFAAPSSDHATTPAGPLAIVSNPPTVSTTVGVVHVRPSVLVEDL